MIPISQPNTADISQISTACPHCGMHHATTCSLIKAIEYHPNGTVKRVELKTAADWPQAQMMGIETPYWQSPVISKSA